MNSDETETSLCRLSPISVEIEESVLVWHNGWIVATQLGQQGLGIPLQDVDWGLEHLIFINTTIKIPKIYILRIDSLILQY